MLIVVNRRDHMRLADTVTYTRTYQQLLLSIIISLILYLTYFIVYNWILWTIGIHRTCDTYNIPLKHIAYETYPYSHLEKNRYFWLSKAVRMWPKIEIMDRAKSPNAWSLVPLKWSNDNVNELQARVTLQNTQLDFQRARSQILETFYRSRPV